MFNGYARSISFFSTLIFNRRQRREASLRDRAYATIYSNSQGYPHYTSEETLADDLKIHPERAAEILQSLIDGGRVEVTYVSERTRLFKARTQPPQPSA